MSTIPGIESKVTGFLRTDLSEEAQTAIIDVDFVDEDDNTVAIVLQADTLEFTVDPLNETGIGSENMFAASNGAHPTVAGRTRLATVERGLLRYGTGQTGAAGTSRTWPQGTKVAVSTAALMRSSNIVKARINAIYPNQNTIQIPVYADAAARDAAITSPVNGNLAYRTDTGLNTQYIGGAWTNVGDTGTPNASATVAGKVEIATTAQAEAGTDTGETGALLSVLPSDIIALIAALEVAVEVPAGTVSAYAGSSAPTGYLLCDGTTGLDSVADTTLAALYAIIGITYGGVDAEDFDLPDLRERVPVGLKAGGTFTPLGDTGGAETHTLIEAEIPAHTHNSPRASGGGAGASMTSANQTPTFDAPTDSTGDDGAHNNLQPYMVMNYIIKK